MKNKKSIVELNAIIKEIKTFDYVRGDRVWENYLAGRDQDEDVVAIGRDRLKENIRVKWCAQDVGGIFSMLQLTLAEQ
ncbi:hypothetical protein HK101_011603 [Irineochytrium annulatum]|nr:hypothetical protein HK101_011603 [Irineochytrium annulatum]